MFSIRVWDLPTRLCHGALALLFLALVISGQIGGDTMVWHMRFGFAMLSLVMWRILWGFMGGYWSRFSSFVSTPLQAWRFARQSSLAKTTRVAGHNPLGAWSVLAMLSCLGLQAMTGLFSDDQISTSGPLTALVSQAWVERATQWHTGLGKWGLMALVVLHLGSIFWYVRVRRVDLLNPMLTGDQILDNPARESTDTIASRLMAAMLLLLCASAVGLSVGIGPL